MKKFTVSTLATFALAVPLGIGGLILTAPVTATDADANFIQRIKHHFNTCSQHVIWECDSRVHKRILGRFGSLFLDPQWYPYDSNGADQATFGTLEWRLRNRYGSGYELSLIPTYLSEVYSDDDIPDSFDHPWRGRGFISPEWRTRYERQVEEEAERMRLEMERQRTENQERAFARFHNDCANSGGRLGIVLPTALGALQLIRTSSFRCNGGSGEVGEFTGYDPDNPDENPYTTALQISPVTPLGSLTDIEEIADHRQVTSDNRETIVTIVDEFNTLEERVLGNNERITENSFLIEAVADMIVDVDDRARKNTAGIALGYALGTPGLLADKRFAFGGGVGSFEGESAVAFTLTGRITDSIVANVGGGMAGSGDTGVNGFKGTISFQW